MRLLILVTASLSLRLVPTIVLDVDVKKMAMRQANLDLFLHPVKKACTEVDQEASLYKCNLCHKTFQCTQGLGSHMATSHREKDKEAGGIRAPKFGSAKLMAPCKI